MIHISLHTGCFDGLGCGDNGESVVQAQVEPRQARSRRSTSSLMPSLVSCQAALHPYDPGTPAQDRSGCLTVDPGRAASAGASSWQRAATGTGTAVRTPSFA